MCDLGQSQREVFWRAAPKTETGDIIPFRWLVDRSQVGEVVCGDTMGICRSKPRVDAPSINGSDPSAATDAASSSSSPPVDESGAASSKSSSKKSKLSVLRWPRTERVFTV